MYYCVYTSSCLETVPHHTSPFKKRAGQWWLEQARTKKKTFSNDETSKLLANKNKNDGLSCLSGSRRQGSRLKGECHSIADQA